MRAKFIYESIDDILKPKSKDDIKNELSKLSKEELNDKLFYASLNGDYSVVEFLIKHNLVNINVQGNYGDTALINASANGHIDIVELLIKLGADVNIKDRYGDTALFYAVMHKYNDLCELLLKSGAKVNIKDKDGTTPKSLALNNGFDELFNLLNNMKT